MGPPVSQAVLTGSSAVLRVLATGSEPLAYQWQFNGAFVVGATQSFLPLSAVQSTNVGTYNVVITNASGSVTSLNAVVSLATPPCFLWARGESNGAYGASYYPPVGYTRGQGIAADASGNVYVAGWSQAPWVDLGGVVLTNSVSTNVMGSPPTMEFLCKYDASGNLLWSRQPANLTLPGGPPPLRVGTDGSGNVYFAGHFQGTASFGSNVLVSVGAADMFVAKYDPQGQALWARRINAFNNIYSTYFYVLGFTVDAAGNAYLASWDSGTADFGAIILTISTGFLAKYDPAGTLLWATESSPAYAIAAGTNGAVYLVGSSGQGNILAKYDAPGTLAWSRSFPMSRAIALDGQENIFVTGCDLGTYDGLTITNTDVYGDYDFFVARCTPAGHLVWLRQAGSTNEEEGYGIALDKSSNVYVTGASAMLATESRLVFGLTVLTNAMTFVAKYNAAGDALWALAPTTTNRAAISGIAVTDPANVFVDGWFGTGGGSFTYSPPFSISFGSFTLEDSTPTMDEMFVAKLAGVEPDGPPAIRTQPQSQLVPASASTTFTVGVLSNPPLTCQWLLNRTNVLAGATNLSLTLTNVQLTDAGQYSIALSNVYGSATSSPASLAVFSLPPTNCAVCSGQPAQFALLANSPAPLLYQWQVSGNGGVTFTNVSATATNASYTNLVSMPANNGNQYRVIVVGVGNLSQTSAPSALLSVFTAPTASAGSNQTICSGSATPGLGGSVGGGATGGVWTTTGTGIFLPSATTLNAGYAPSASDIATGAITLRLTTTGQQSPCGAATAQVVVNINPRPSALVTTGATICGAGTASLTASGSGGNLRWYADPGLTALVNTGPNYAPTVGSSTAYYVTETSAAGCVSLASMVIATVNTPAAASAGGNQTICSSSATAGLGGWVGGGATGGTWSSPTGGIFLPDATTLNATYTPSAADVSAGTVTLTLSSTGQLAPCPAATARVVVTIHPFATVGAGGNQTICPNNCTAGLGGSVGGGATGGHWTSSGNGSFLGGATNLNARYCPSAADIAAGTVTLTLTSTGQQSPCGEATAEVIVTINPRPSAPLTTGAVICGAGTASLSASGSGGLLKWCSDASQSVLVNTGTSYSPTVAGTTTYYVTETSASGCRSLASPVTVTVNTPATASAGGNQTICSMTGRACLGGSVGGSATGGTWSTSGSGTFSPDATTLNATYCPSAGDLAAGAVTLTLRSTGQAASCDAATAHVSVIINILGQASATQSLVDNHDGTYTLHLVGTPGAQYYVVYSGDITGLKPAWSQVVGSTNTADGDGKWSCVVSNPSPAYYRPIAVNPAQ